MSAVPPVVDTVITVLENSVSEANGFFLIFELNQDSDMDGRLRQIESHDWTAKHTVTAREQLIRPDCRIYVSDGDDGIGTQTILLEDNEHPMYSVRIGVQEYADGKGQPPLSTEQIKRRPYHSEKQLDPTYMPFVPCRDIQRYFLRWSGSYLKWGDCLHCPREKSIFTSEHLLVSRIFDKSESRLKVAYVSASNALEFFVNNTDSFNIIRTNPLAPSLKCILGILNSRFIGEYLKKINVNLQRAIYPKVNTKDLKAIPIPILTADQQARITKLVDSLVALSGKVCLDNERSHIEYAKKITELDEVVTKLFRGN